MSSLVLFNKPYGVLSQFSGEGTTSTLADFIDIPRIYPAGRLDKDSEGLLLLTDDGKLQQKISDPKFKKYKTYLAQLEGSVTEAAIEQLRQGIELKDGRTLAAKVKAVPDPGLWPRTPAVRYRKNIPTSWIELSIREGRNRQVRRMTAAVGFPTLRLVRTRVDQWELGDLQPGDWIRLEAN